MIPEDPFADGGIIVFAEKFRRGQVTSVAVTKACLARIEALNASIGAFWHIDAEGALATAAAMDAAFSAGVYLSQLMGVPVAVKDLLVVDAMPVTFGSDLDLSEMIGFEGHYIKCLRNAGCVILGKTATVELAFGTTGINETLGTPRNPHDPEVFRVCGGSSSGSGAAIAAGLAGFAVGTDTGGSVRIPAALCGIFGHKTTKGLYDTNGVFPVSPTFDTIGPLTRSAADAALIFSATTGTIVPEIAAPTLQFLKPSNYFFNDLAVEVSDAVFESIERLTTFGASFVDVEIPEVSERAAIYPEIVPSELMSAIGAERFAQGRAQMDSLTASRAEYGLNVSAVSYIDALKRMRELTRIVAQRLDNQGTLITPTVPIIAPKKSELADIESGVSIHNQLVRNAQPAGIFNHCAVSLPVQKIGKPSLPVGLQLSRGEGEDALLLGIARTVEKILGVGERPQCLFDSSSDRVQGD